MAVAVAKIESVPLFAGLEPDHLVLIAANMEEREVEPGDHLSIEGASGYFFFVIEDGTASVAHDGEVVAELGPGDFFGEAAILENIRRTATVTATSPMRLAVMFGADFAKLAADEPKVADRVHAAMAERAAGA
jgi:CRP-like cAMP-binding protein